MPGAAPDKLRQPPASTSAWCMTSTAEKPVRVSSTTPGSGANISAEYLSATSDQRRSNSADDMINTGTDSVDNATMVDNLISAPDPGRPGPSIEGPCSALDRAR